MPMCWTFRNLNADQAKSILEKELQATGVPSFASVSWEQNTMLVKIDKGGKSEFKITLQNQGTDTKFVETKRDVALFHKPFVGKVESFVDQILNKAGAAKA
ncbi:MAG: hypothetical protein EBR09_01270 [Proteobacteria bacterium]|nr:hypothetical protein [Pseudomonadota bacterium]